MKIAIIGYKGMGGTALTDVALSRGHNILGLDLRASTDDERPGLECVAVDLFDVPALQEQMSRANVVISAFSGGHAWDDHVYYVQGEGTRRIIQAFKRSSAGYLVYIGGAASLYVKPGVQMLDDDRYPGWYFGTHRAAHLRWLAEITHDERFSQAADRREQHHFRPSDVDEETVQIANAEFTHNPLLEGCRLALDLFEGRTDFDWTFLSPPWAYRPGKGTGHYELGVDYMIYRDGIPSGIAVPDLAAAVIDEVEHRNLVHKHWTLAGDQD